ncbi:unnamed protein product [Lymnaea stagnalis]|uniref:Uncharacterized protein n=1 Tax=Lymnaea stagnalis TaxID=6523 RepID=A0AAV2I422_LYMST
MKTSCCSSYKTAMLSDVDHFSTCLSTLSEHPIPDFGHPTMSPVLKLSVVCLVLAVSALMPQTSQANPIGVCWDTWSRCSEWSKFLSGTVWLTCPQKCQELGHRTGDCVLVPSKCPIASEAYQCQCSD